MFSPPAILADLALEQSGVRPPGEADVMVRPYPYPYVAALALSNDVDSMNRAAFEDWHGFVSGTGPTSYGQGLGLEVADSFWIWSGTRNDALSIYRCYPDDEDWIESPNLPRIVELAKAGWLDTLHSLGNWRPTTDPAGPGDRQEASRGLAALDRLGVKPKVFVNHGGSPSNVGSIWATYQKSDDPEHPMYCLDLLRKAGFSYYWIDQCTSMGKFGDHLLYETERQLRSRIANYPWSDWLRRSGKRLDEDPPDFPAGQGQLRRLLVEMFNETIVPVDARDGSRILAFKRYRGPFLPTASTFPIQVTSGRLDTLERQRGVVIVYQHFGVQSLRGRAKSKVPSAKSRSAPPVLDVHEVACWRDLAERWRAGRLFIATTARLLDWLWLRDRLQIQLTGQPDKWIVTLVGVRCSVTGDRAVEASDLNGLSLLVPQDAPEVVVVGPHGRPVPLRREADPAHAECHALFRPWSSLEWPG